MFIFRLKLLLAVTLFILPIATVKSQSTPTLDSHTTAVVTYFIKKPEHISFPDRNAQHIIAVQADIAKEQTRLEAIRAANSQKQAFIQQLNKNEPQIATNASDDVFLQLSYCEAGGKANTNTGNGYYGAFQYDIRTWANFMGYARPDLAPWDVQLAKAKQTQATRGWSPWPSCSKKLGLM